LLENRSFKTFERFVYPVCGELLIFDDIATDVAVAIK